MNVIELDSISRTFGLGNGATKALHEVTFNVEKGEFLALMGPSGSGKSTLLNIIGLLDSPDEGSYILSGKDVSHLNSRKKAKIRRNHIGFIFQNFNLISRLNVLENVSLPLMYKGVSQTRRYERASEILDYLGIQEKEYYLPYQLSGGQLQRAAIARAMVNRPSIVLADEPTGNLDTKASKLVMAALKEIHEAGNTIVMVTHNPDVAQYAERVIKFVDGKIEEELTDAALKRELSREKRESAEIATVPRRSAIKPARRRGRKPSKKKSKKGKK